MVDKIDIVVTWVDGADQKWKGERAKHSGSDQLGLAENRFRDWGLLKYWFRAIEKNASWANKIYFVSYGHIPEWLNIDNEKLVIVKHSDFIPKEFLPTFSSHPIELNLHRIHGLSEQFVYLNDDVFIINKTHATDFFKNGKPRDRAVLTVSCPVRRSQIQYICLNNIGILNEDFGIKKQIFKKPLNWFNPIYGKDLTRTVCLLSCPRFPGIKHEHLNSNMLKSSYEQLWKMHADVLGDTCKRKFRTRYDVNQWLIKDYQIISNKILPQKRIGKMLAINNKKDADAMFHTIADGKDKIVCVNDGEKISQADFSNIKETIQRAFEIRFPEKSSYEK